MKVKVKSLSRVRLFVTPWTVAYQAPPSKGFSRREYWSGSLAPLKILKGGMDSSCSFATELPFKTKHWGCKSSKSLRDL